MNSALAEQLRIQTGFINTRNGALMYNSNTESNPPLSSLTREPTPQCFSTAPSLWLPPTSSSGPTMLTPMIIQSFSEVVLATNNLAITCRKAVASCKGSCCSNQKAKEDKKEGTDLPETK